MSLIDALSELFIYNPKAPMIFNSGAFFILFIVFLIVYSLIYRKRLAVVLFVIAFSFFFYYKSSGFYLAILVFTSFTDYYFALYINRSSNERMRRLLLTLAVGSSLLLLAFFKYTNFFIENILVLMRYAGYFPSIENLLRSQPAVFQLSWVEIVQSNFQPLDIFLPIGISFYTFQSVSYVIDVYRKRIKPTTSILDYAFFLSFFPQLVAGPIVKANLFIPQLEKPFRINRREMYSGLYLIIIGLIKKAVVADYISQYNDLIFANPTGYSGFENLMAVYGYALQIFCDFSGYSDIAIGLGKMLGFDLGINFRFPYQARNITDFWRRWHISLSSWLREYLYIPLGGNRNGKVRMYINLFLTMLIGGLWHGASWKFVFWGGMHGAGLALHKAVKPWLSRWFPDSHITNTISWLVTFHFVILLWVFFRATDFSTAVSLLNQIVTAFDWAYVAPFVEVRKLWIILIIVGFSSHIVSDKMNKRLMFSFVKLPYVVKLILFIIAVQLVIQFRSEDVQPFIYFQF